ncbi:hypothetical protein A2715_03475 [Candidatus Woesebacteria bacterium RIFCSPHIGHO2_01_FULL_39_32]|uniref:Uncharacterized protein n=1 Tax=Candidatus Woesebacteria bacterium RIFCSPLOWO2_01_FULL_39_25 TaxID=1802521 RepID=A0A1F8BKP0_9BACT|nr:MAG: hypothetical protein A2715_03475 [Candidatus Woesebacteria bacterium RIFCSPHIGHO2_01_FULL_39_32]OGM37121.1 MAG: hypothetical protein A3F01_05415 [Candidatus Woesebacteria bacterium RIFCSPHIGHO2_12_FULL_38_11]OGM64626.1 MAG: hypothetical protein A2893_06390 [Candidatus Woesebacteria bacterium RIFCSPLOWO2_01_FULL_39_25]
MTVTKRFIIECYVCGTEYFGEKVLLEDRGKSIPTPYVKRVMCPTCKAPYRPKKDFFLLVEDTVQDLVGDKNGAIQKILDCCQSESDFEKCEKQMLNEIKRFPKLINSFERIIKDRKVTGRDVEDPDLTKFFELKLSKLKQIKEFSNEEIEEKIREVVKEAKELLLQTRNKYKQNLKENDLKN